MAEPEDKVLLVSFPKSGSNWVRYCVEHFSGLRTPGSARQLLVRDGPTVIDRTHFLNKPDRRQLIENSVRVEPWPEGQPRKIRSWPDRWIRNLLKARRTESIVQSRRMLLLVRSPYALYTRVRATDAAAMAGYLSNIEIFHRCRRDKLVVYYEDMVNDFDEIVKILRFVGIPHDLRGFDLAEHRRRSFELYRQGQDGPATAANVTDVTYHARKLDPEQHGRLRAYCLERLGPALFAKYLSRYDGDMAGASAAGRASRPMRLARA